MDDYEDFERLRAKAEAMGYRLWKWSGWFIERNGTHVKRFINQFDAATLDAWLDAKANDPMKLHPATPAQRAAWNRTRPARRMGA